MALPTLTPSSEISKAILPGTGSYTVANVVSNYPFGLYADEDSDLYDRNFITGAVEQVTYVYRKLGGDVLDIELTEKNIYSSYEEAVLEYSYIVNVHQAKNILHSSLGATTGSFDSDGELLSSASDSLKDVALKYPRFELGYSRRIMDNTITEVGQGGTQAIYSASFETSNLTQDYDLQEIIQTSSSASEELFYNKVNNNRVKIRRVYYKTPHAMWRFYGYYGGLNTVGNMSTYGMYADDSTYEIIPPWQNKLQAIAYEDAIYTRNSHYSYEIKNNKIRVHPIPTSVSPDKYWVEFTVDQDPWKEQSDRKDGIEGVNNMNTLPLSNIPYKNINSIGKQWIRRFAVALSKEVLGQVRSKFGQIPIPNSSVQLNGTALITEGKEEQAKLREELQKILDEMTYEKMTEVQTNMAEKSQGIIQTYPMFIYQG